jgi:hypothetical protein
MAADDKTLIVRLMMMMMVVVVGDDGDGIGGTKEEQRKLDEGRQTEGMLASQYCAPRATTGRSNQRSTLS